MLSKIIKRAGYYKSLMHNSQHNNQRFISYRAIGNGMTTTIQVNDDTMQFLKLLREQYKATSYDALLKMLVEKAMKPSKSLWGAGGKMTMKEILKDLRDKSDRY